MLFISLEQETHNSKAWQGGREVGRQSGGRKKGKDGATATVREINLEA